MELTEADLTEIANRFPTHFGEPKLSVLIQRALTELRDCRAEYAQYVKERHNHDATSAKLNEAREKMLSLAVMAATAAAKERDAALSRIAATDRVVEACDAGLTALWDAYDAGSWEMHHHEDDNGLDCPEDDTCECDGKHAANLLSKATGMVTSWMRIRALSATEQP